MSESLLHHVALDAKDSQLVQVLYRLELFYLQQLVVAYIQDLQVFNISKLVKQRYTVVAEYYLPQTLKPRELVSISYRIM